MKQVGAIITLKLAKTTDVFVKGEGSIIENREVFFRSKKTRKFEGPYFLDENQDHLELFLQVEMKMVYLVDFKNTPDSNTNPFKLILKQAAPADITYANNKVRYNMMYFLLAPGNNIQGPFFITSTTNKHALVQHIKDQKLYVLSRKQKFNFITKQKIAS